MKYFDLLIFFFLFLLSLFIKLFSAYFFLYVVKEVLMRTSLWIDCHWIQPWRLPWWPSLTSKCSFENSPFKTLKLKLLKFTNNVLGDWRKSVMQFTKLWYMRQIFHSLIWFHSLWIVRIQVSCARKFNRLKCLDLRTKKCIIVISAAFR